MSIGTGMIIVVFVGLADILVLTFLNMLLERIMSRVCIMLPLNQQIRTHEDLDAFIICAYGPIIEELSFRFVPNIFAQKYDLPLLLVLFIANIFFALAHFRVYGIKLCWIVFPSGLGYCIAFYVFGIDGAIIAHSVYNTILLAVEKFSTSRQSLQHFTRKASQ